MNCNKIIHGEIKEECIICPFFDQEIGYKEVKKYLCCDKMDIVEDSNGGNICKNCGIVQFYDNKSEYMDVNQNKYKIIRKSIYHKQCHLINKLNSYNLVSSFTVFITSSSANCLLSFVSLYLANLVFST